MVRHLYKYIKRFLFTFLLFIAESWCLFLYAQSSIPDAPSYKDYSFIKFIDDKPDSALTRISDDEFLDEAGKIVFRVNRYDVFTNDSLLHELDKVILPLINQDSLKLRLMVVRGAASPEGPVPNNRMLGRRRVETLVNFLRARLSVPVDSGTLSTESVTEDYRLLLAMMRRQSDPDLAVVQRLCDSHLPRYEYTRLKINLQRQQSGRLWKRLLREYFPELRATRIVLFFEQTKETPVTPEIPVIPETPEITDTLESQEPADTIYLTLPRRELLSVKTNLLLDLAYMPGYNRWCPIPNIAVEYYPQHGHFTYGASLDFPWWQHHNDHKFFEIRNYQLETRYYTHSGDINLREPGEGAAFRGLYFSVYGHAALYSICFNKNKGWEGEALGAGLGIGYVLPISRTGHWRLEFAAQFGFIYSGYDPYQFENTINPAYHDNLYYYKWSGNVADFRKRQYRYSWIGPTRVGVTLSYDLLYRKWKKNGASLKSTERRAYEK